MSRGVIQMAVSHRGFFVCGLETYMPVGIVREALEYRNSVLWFCLKLKHLLSIRKLVSCALFCGKKWGETECQIGVLADSKPSHPVLT